MDLTALQTSLRQFAAERDWAGFHTPKNLAMALMVEAAELAEIFQWMTPEQSQQVIGDRLAQERIGEEVADVLLYLLQLADYCAIDIKRAVGRKLVKNARKHPPLHPGAPAAPATVLPSQTHVLVDWENVQPREADIRALVPDVTDVWIFHGRTQKNVAAHQKSFGDRLTLVRIERAGKNALDFHLSFYMGYITARNPQARFVVISNDQGYGPMLEHAQELGFGASQIGFSKGRPARKAAAPRKTAAPAKAPAKASAPAQPAAPAKAPAVRKTTAASTKARAVPAATPPAKPPAPAAKKTAARRKPAAKAAAPRVDDQAYAHVLASLRKAPNKPARQARFKGMVKSFLRGGQADEAAVDAVIARLVEEHYVEIDAKGAVLMRL